MTKQLQPRISRMGLAAASAALVLAVLLVFGVMTTPSAQAQTFTDLYNFTGPTDGGYPYAGVVRDAAGNLYGTTYYGGTSGYGTVFQVDKKGTETVLHNFTNGTDGGYPIAGLIRDEAGNLYGTTSSGGAHNLGTVFKVNRKGTETVLHSFAGGSTDGCDPYQGVIQDKAGNFYGTTYACGASGGGTVFKLSKQGTLTLLHNFAGGPSDGTAPLYGSLLMDKTGNLYGVTEVGGTAGQGVLYKVNTKGTVRVLHNFVNAPTDGCYPLGSVTMDKMNNIYGTTKSCGTSGAGVVWKVNKKGAESVLYSFTGGADGASPFAGVILDAKGNVYGDTEAGGASGLGAVYELSKKGTETVLHSFAESDGGTPYGGVIMDAKGTLYGTTETGGSGNYGVVWQITKK